jgi:hypothetical protein
MEPDRQFDEKSDVATTAFGGHSLLQKGNKMMEVGMGPSILLNHRRHPAYKFLKLVTTYRRGWILAGNFYNSP